MTPEEIAADRKVIDAATPGPWASIYICEKGVHVWTEYRPMEGRLYVESEQDRNKIPADILGLTPHSLEQLANPKYRKEDCDFIAAARTRWPAALDEIQRLNEVIDSDEVRINELGAICERYAEQNAALRAQVATQAELLTRRAER